MPPEGIPGQGHLWRHATARRLARAGGKRAFPNHNQRPRQMRSPGRYKYNSQQQPLAQNTLQPRRCLTQREREGRGHRFLCSSALQLLTYSYLRYSRPAKKGRLDCTRFLCRHPAAHRNKRRRDDTANGSTSPPQWNMSLNPRRKGMHVKAAGPTQGDPGLFRGRFRIPPGVHGRVGARAINCTLGSNKRPLKSRATNAMQADVLVIFMLGGRG